MRHRFLITGVAGFIGSHVARQILHHGGSVIGVDNFLTGLRANLAEMESHPDFTLIEADVRETEKMEEAASGVECVIHLAGSEGRSGFSTRELLAINAWGTRSVLEACKEHCPRFILASSSSVYGKNSGGPVNEETPAILGETRKSGWASAVSKMFAEHLCYAYAEKYEIPFTILRYFGATGSGMKWDSAEDSLELDDVSLEAMRNLCFCDVEDLVRGTLAACESEECIGEVINLGTTETIPSEDLPSPLVDRLPIHRYTLVPDLDKAKRLLGYSPKISPHEAVRRLIHWMTSASKQTSP